MKKREKRNKKGNERLLWPLAASWWMLKHFSASQPAKVGKGVWSVYILLKSRCKAIVLPSGEGWSVIACHSDDYKDRPIYERGATEGTASCSCFSGFWDYSRERPNCSHDTCLLRSSRQHSGLVGNVRDLFDAFECSYQKGGRTHWKQETVQL